MVERRVILVDTSIWIDHLRQRHARLVALLTAEQVLSHPFVVGELACGSIGGRGEMLTFIADLPRSVVAHDDEVLRLIDRRALMGSGIGYLDAHLLTSTLLTQGARLWSRDRRLAAAANQCGIGYEPG